jgi:nucleoside-diphosphate-sugar epimerase
MATGETTQWALYGGMGFIGQHLALSVLNTSLNDSVTLLDIQEPGNSTWKVPLERHLADGRLRVIKADVRDFQQLAACSKPYDVIVNLAAVHREPGHKPEEYFETNIGGAKNVCRLADSVGCKEIIFTSSISVYGVHDRSVDEQSTPEPKTPYGQSKLKAEQIHAEWARNSDGRLSIIRPGVVFGPGEAGNVTRLLRESLRLHRKIQISPDQPKAGIYIDELLSIIHWLREQPLSAGEHQLVNGVSDENLAFNDFGEALQELKYFEKKPLTISEPMLKLAISMMKPLGWILGTNSKIHPERLAKLKRANDVKATGLISAGYPFVWPLKKALADWLEKGL